MGVPVHFVVTQSGFLALLWQLASLILGEVVFAALTIAAAAAYTDASPDFTQNYRAVLAKFWTLLELLFRLFGAALLLAITIVGIPLAVRTLVRWFFGTQAVMLNDLSAKDAISFSCRLVKGRWWQVAGTILLVSLGFASPYVVATVIWWPYSTASLITNSILSVAIGPLLAIFWTLLFLQLGERAAPVAPATSTSDRMLL